MVQQEKKKIVVLGGSGHAKQIIDTLRRIGTYDIVGFLDDNTSRETLFGVPRIGPLFPAAKNLPTNLVALGIGHVGKVTTRKKLIREYKEAGYTFETIISPTAIITDHEVTIAEGVYVGDLTVISPGVTIEKYVIINNKSCINHESVIGENTHVAPGVMVSGNVKIGQDCMIGTGSSILQGVKIGNNCLIGMGTAVVKHCQDGTVYSIVSK